MLNPFSLAFPTHWFSPPLHLLPCPHINHSSFAPHSTTSFSASHIHCHNLCLLASSPSPLFASPLYLPSLTPNVIRKGSVNLDTPIQTFLLDLPGLTSSRSSTDHVYGSWTSRWTSLLLLFSPAHSSPSSHVSPHSHCCPTQLPPHPFPSYHYSPLTQVSSATTKTTLHHCNSFLNVSLCNIYTTSRPLSPSPPCLEQMTVNTQPPFSIDICLPFEPAILFLKYNCFSSPCQLWRLILYC